MAVILFRLDGVPDDEADDVRQLLVQNGIVFYETPPGKWGFSVAAIWLKDTAQFDVARGLIEAYQRDRTLRMKASYDRLSREGRVESFVERSARHPIRFLFYLALILVILYLSIKPFMDMGK